MKSTSAFNSSSRPRLPASSWVFTTCGLLALLLVARELSDFFLLGNQESTGSRFVIFENLWFFLWAFPFCHFLGLSLASHYSIPKACFVAFAAGGAMCLVGIGLTLVGPLIGLSLLSVFRGPISTSIPMAFLGTPAIAGILYALGLDTLQRQLFGRSSARASWRILHLMWGAIAGVIVFFLVNPYAYRPSLTGTFDFGPLWSNLKIALLLVAVALPNYLCGWRLARKQQLATVTEHWRGFAAMRIVVLGVGVVSAVWLAERYLDPRVSQFESRPPGHSWDGRYIVPIGDRIYFIPPSQIEYADWNARIRRYHNVRLDLLAADDGDLARSDISPIAPFQTVRIDAYTGNDRTSLLPCEREVIGTLTGCWLPDPRVQGPPIPSSYRDLWLAVDAPELMASYGGLLLLNQHDIFVAALLPDVNGGDDDHDLVVSDGAVRWHVPVSSNNFAHVPDIVESIRSLQIQFRDSPNARTE